MPGPTNNLDQHLAEQEQLIADYHSAMFFYAKERESVDALYAEQENFVVLNRTTVELTVRTVAAAAQAMHAGLVGVACLLVELADAQRESAAEYLDGTVLPINCRHDDFDPEDPSFSPAVPAR